MFGIDVSEHKGTINWDKVKSQIDFAILRLGWIGNKDNHTLDKQFEKNYSECKRLNIPIGIYVYNYCESEVAATSGANWVIQKLQNKSIELPIYIDMENDDKQPQKLSRLGKTKLTAIVNTFNKQIESNKFWAGVYANRDWFDNYLNKDEIKKHYTTWIATYVNAIDKYKGEYDMWQNSSDGKISGISGNVDTNYMYRNLIAEIGNTKHSVPTQKTMSVVDLAYEVIDGKYGDDEERKKALGSLYDDVQAKVNEILNDKKQITYTVKKGDTLSAIAKKYNTTYQEIAKKNNISNPNKINIGQKLKI